MSDAPTPIRLAMHGALGRMGTRICELARTDARFELVAELDAKASSDGRRDVTSTTDAAFDLLIDFSSDAGAARAAELAVRQGAALLVGTTGLSAQTSENIELAARRTPVLTAPNTSLGVAVVNHLVEVAARLLGAAYDIDLVEAHHTAKRDAPSGTALRFARTIRDRAGARLPDDRIHCLRAGDIIGEHTVQFAGPGEIVKISHSAVSRDLFALGALRAGAWLCGRKPGRYTIEQAYGIAEAGAPGGSRPAYSASSPGSSS